jgi:hypothetical protein
LLLLLRRPFLKEYAATFFGGLGLLLSARAFLVEDFKSFLWRRH